MAMSESKYALRRETSLSTPCDSCASRSVNGVNPEMSQNTTTPKKGKADDRPSDFGAPDACPEERRDDDELPVMEEKEKDEEVAGDGEEVEAAEAAATQDEARADGM